jgi:hypothetical protein
LKAKPRSIVRSSGRFATFHLDHSFGLTLDGMIVVDLTRTEPRFLERYLGKEGAANFRTYQDEMREPGLGTAGRTRLKRRAGGRVN